MRTVPERPRDEGRVTRSRTVIERLRLFHYFAGRSMESTRGTQCTLTGPLQICYLFVVFGPAKVIVNPTRSRLAGPACAYVRGKTENSRSGRRRRGGGLRRPQRVASLRAVCRRAAAASAEEMIYLGVAALERRGDLYYYTGNDGESEGRRAYMTRR